MTIWVLGDSYAEQYNGLTDQWMQCISNRLEMDIKSFGLVGSSAEYTYKSFFDIRNDIKKHDVVIVMLTTHSRRWFFDHYPDYSGHPSPGGDYDKPYLIYNSTGFKEVDDALLLYEDHLNNHEVFKVYLENFLHNLNNITKKLQLHTIIMMNFYDTFYFLEDKKNLFSHIHFGNGMMLDVSLNEFKKDYLRKFNIPSTDIRVNHLLKSNHKILANKIVDKIKNDISVDLTTGFIKHVLDNNILADQDFINDELFNGILK